MELTQSGGRSCWPTATWRQASAFPSGSGRTRRSTRCRSRDGRSPWPNGRWRIGPFQPEPYLPDAQYEQALEVLRNARNALERTPSMTAHLDEERIRDLLFVFLNAQFEGAAAGEVFNGAGKSDILIRAQRPQCLRRREQGLEGPQTIRVALDPVAELPRLAGHQGSVAAFIRSGDTRRSSTRRSRRSRCTRTSNGSTEP